VAAKNLCRAGGQAIALANDSDFGLGGSVFTEDIARGRKVASRVDTGMMFINNISCSDAELPFGGIKDSGYLPRLRAPLPAFDRASIQRRPEFGGAGQR
jgi:acyl-CoA reductase-like NAD-dependent aldehyde dehydrogenase